MKIPMNTFVCLMALVCSLLVSVVFVSPGFARKPGGRDVEYSMYEAGRRNLEPALQRAAARFYPDSPFGHLYVVLTENRVEMHADGVEFENFIVSLDTGKELGRFTRMRLMLGSECRVDVAFLVRNAVIEDALVLRVPVVNNKPFTCLEKIVQRLCGRNLADFAKGISRFCTSLVTLSRQGSAGDVKSSDLFSNDVAEKLLASMGEPVDTLPDFTVTDAFGKERSAGEYRGKPLLILNGSLACQDSVSVLRCFEHFSRQREGAVGLICSWMNMDHVFDRERYFLPKVDAVHIVDFDRSFQKTFGLVAVPHIIGFDAQGKRILSRYYTSDKETTKAIDDFCRKTCDQSFLLSGKSAGAPIALDKAFLSDKGPSPIAAAAIARLFGILPSAIVSLEQKGESSNVSQGFMYRELAFIDNLGEQKSFTWVHCGRGVWKDYLVTLKKEVITGLVCLPLHIDSQNGSLSDEECTVADSILAHFNNRVAEDIGGPLSAFFSGLTYLPIVADGRTPQKLVEMAKAPIVHSMKIDQAAPKTGDICPEFRGLGLNGHRVSRHTYKGKPFIVFAGSLEEPASLQAQNVVQGIAESLEGKVGLVNVYANTAGLVLNHRRRGKSFAGEVVCDPDQKIIQSFKLPYLPYFLCFDKNHILKVCTPYRGIAGTKALLAEYLEEMKK